ncbi:unnamed protein product, partial [Brenthis ino]
MSHLNDSNNCAVRYSNLIKDVESLSTDDLKTAIPALTNILRKGKELYSSEGNTTLDSHLLRKSSNVVVSLTSKATNEITTYDRHELAFHIRNHKNLWQFSFPYEVPVFSYLYGTFDPNPIEHRPKQRRKINRQIAASVKAPAKVAKIKNNSEEKPSAAVELHNYLKTKCTNSTCSYFHLVLDPTSFTRTIENIYNVSILIKDNLVGIFVDADTGLPFLNCVQKGKRPQNTGEKQFIESIDKKRWADLIEAFGIKEPLRQVEDEEYGTSDEN